MMKILILLFFLPFFASADEVAVLLYFDDGESPPFSALNKKGFEEYPEKLTERGVDKIIPIFFPYGFKNKFSTKWFKEKLFDSGLRDHHVVKTLIIATHGTTDTKNNNTVLEEIGGFDDKGAYGLLKDMLSTLQPRFSEHIHIFLNACSTLCGDVELVKGRLSGLLKSLESNGVKSFTLWGALQPIAGHPINDEEREFLLVKQPLLIRKLQLANIPYSFGISSILEIALNLIESGKFIPPDQLTLYLGLLIGATGTAFLEVFHRFMTKIGFDGYLASVSSQGVKVENVDFMESKAIHGYNLPNSCIRLITR